MTGTIARVMADKKFGFIKGEDHKDYFFHQSDVNGFFDDFAEDFINGIKIFVTFESVESVKGPRAGNVTRV